MNAPVPHLTRPHPPVFDTPAAEREHNKRRLVAAFRIFAEFGFDEGIMGHISFRDPEVPEHVWMNPFAMNFALIEVKDLLRFSWDGQLIEGSGHIHPSGWRLHSKLYQVQPRLQAIAHAHSMYGKVWSTLDRLLDPISTESGLFHKRHILYDSYEEGEGERVGQALGAARAVIMKNHGILTVGETVDEAAYSFIALERACKAQILAEATATGPKPLPDVHADALSDGYKPESSWLNFQPLYNRVAHAHPELVA